MDHYIKASSLVTDELTNRKVGIHLWQPVFDHGQLYVSFSCVQSSENFKVLVMESNSQGLLTNNRISETTNSKNFFLDSKDDIN